MATTIETNQDSGSEPQSFNIAGLDFNSIWCGDSRHSVFLSGARVLIADDCPHTQLLLSHVLESVGCDVCCAMDGIDCLDTARDALKKKHPFDFVILDLAMPRMDGVKTARLLRGMEDGYRGIIIATSARDRTDEISLRNAGCNYFLAKSELHNELLPVLARYLI